MGNPASMAEGIAAAMEAGIQIAELIEEMAVYLILHLSYKNIRCNHRDKQINR